MLFDEVPLIFDCAGDQLIGLITLPEHPFDTGVLMLVGGRQYRAGSHRQFVTLARRLASAGFPSLRFDYRGLGDSSGERRLFDQVDDDIAAALDAWRQANTGLRRFVLCGLCDGATAGVLYCGRRLDARVAGWCLISPWMRSDEGLARVRVRHYYTGRLVDATFWTKLLSGRLGFMQAMREFQQSWRVARSGESEGGFQYQVLMSLRNFPGPMLWLTAGNDLTAKEFQDALQRPAGKDLARRADVESHEIPDADHTFSRTFWQDAAEICICNWLASRREFVEIK